ncbi:hypothetical protein IH799_06450 [candidate division KSB1 bacterium]|nr:hypothetical protein [candidate division KSB1 bacterium]
MQIVRSLVKFLGVAAAIWTVGVSGFIMFAPTQSQVSTHMTLPDGTIIREEGHSSTSLLERQGWAGVFGFILWPLSLPIMIAMTGARAAWLYKQGLLWTMAGIMLLFSFLAGFSIGLAYVPAAAGFLVAAFLNTIQLNTTQPT